MTMMVSSTVAARWLFLSVMSGGLSSVEPFFLFQRPSSPMLRSLVRSLSSPVRHRHLPLAGGGGGGGNSWSGCLSMTKKQMDASYSGSGTTPGCYWESSSGSGGGSSGGGGSGGSSGGSSSGGGGGNGGGGGGNGGNGGGGGDNGNGDGAQGSNENGQGGNGQGGNGQGGNGQGGNNGDGGGDGRNGDNGGNNNNGGNGGNNGGNGGNDGNGNANPYEDFAIDNCPSYEMLWLWDIILECSNENDLSGCTCDFAENLMENGELSCADMDFCPRECPICVTCLTLLGCGASTTATTGGSPNSVSASSRWYLFAAAGAVLLFGLVYYLVRRQRDLEDAELTAVLLAEPEGAEAAAAAYGGEGTGGESVWLAPDTEVEQFEPSMRAALASGGAGAGAVGAAPLIAGGVAAAAGDSDSSLSQSLEAENEDDADVWLAPVSTIS